MSLPLLGEAEIKDLIPKVGPRSIFLRNLEIYKKTMHPDCNVTTVSCCFEKGMMLPVVFHILQALYCFIFLYLNAIIYRLVKIWTFQYQICYIVHLKIKLEQAHLKQNLIQLLMKLILQGHNLLTYNLA